MTLAFWADTDRRELSRLLPESLVVLPLGSVEQHGPHLPTATDSMIASAVVRRASEDAHERSSRPIVVAPTVMTGASDHHLPFGGTISLRSSTLLAVLTDILDSMGASGAARIVMVNGHGGNSGACHQAAAAVSSHSTLAIAHLDYWRVLEDGDRPFPVPGHAGQFETALIQALTPELVRESGQRPDRPSSSLDPAIEIHRAAAWAAMDGYSDHPERARPQTGDRLLVDLVEALSERLVRLAELL